MKEHNTVSFEGQTIFIGMDVHKNSISVCVRHCGIELCKFVFNSDTCSLARKLKEDYPGAKFHSVYEAGFCGFEHHRILLREGIENIVINPADAPTSGRERAYKSDAVDCRKLARELENGSLTPIYIPSKENLLFRDLVRREAQIVKSITQAKNRIRMYYFFHNLKFPGWSGNALKQMEVEAVKEQDETLLSHLRTYRFLREERLRIRAAEKLYIKRFNREVKQKCLTSVPGVGFRVAIVFQAELWEFDRFSDSNHRDSYTGFAPHLVGSGEHEVVQKSGARKKKELHSMLIQAAWRAISKDMELRALYGRQLSKGGTGRAISIVARKLQARMAAVFSQEREYIFAK